MAVLAHSTSEFDRCHIQEAPTHSEHKHNLIQRITILMFFVLAFHSLFTHHEESEPEIQEEETEVVLMLNSEDEERKKWFIKY